MPLQCIAAGYRQNTLFEHPPCVPADDRYPQAHSERWAAGSVGLWAVASYSSTVDLGYRLRNSEYEAAGTRGAWYEALYSREYHALRAFAASQTAQFHDRAGSLVSSTSDSISCHYFLLTSRTTRRISSPASLLHAPRLRSFVCDLKLLEDGLDWMGLPPLPAPSPPCALVSQLENLELVTSPALQKQTVPLLLQIDGLKMLKLAGEYSYDQGITLQRLCHPPERRQWSACPGWRTGPVRSTA